MSNERKNSRVDNRIETEIVEDTRALSAYAYCSLPSHFFDRALAQMKSDKTSGLSMHRWGNKHSNSRMRRE